MSKYIGPKLRLSKRECIDLELKSGIRSIDSKCNFKNFPGQHNIKKKKLSNYGIQLREKQKLKRIYCLLEKQFLNYYKKSLKLKGNTGDNLLRLLELRLDNIVYKMGFSLTRYESRQLINHNFILVNNKNVSFPSYQVSKNDIISISKNKNIKKIKDSLFFSNNKEKIKWLDVDVNNLIGIIKYIPSKEDLIKNINEYLIVELYSK